MKFNYLTCQKCSKRIEEKDMKSWEEKDICQDCE